MKSPTSSLYVRLIASLVDARNDIELTQQQLADRLDKPQSYVAKIEVCERRLDIGEFVDYARALGREPEELFAAIYKSAKRTDR